MREISLKSRSVQIASLIFLFFTVWWIFLFYRGGTGASLPNQIFSGAYGLMALFGAFFGLAASMKWGGTKSYFGRAILMFSLGLFAQEFGQIAYSLYTFLFKIVIPYPSIGDIGYFGSIPLYIYGVLLLAKISGVKISLRSFENKLQAVLIPLGILILSYVIFLRGYQFDWSSPLKIFLDFGYPIGQAMYISLALLTFLLSRKTLGGILRPKIVFVLFALLIQYVADYTFLYQASRGTVYPGGVNDYIYLVSYFFMTLALLDLNLVVSKLKS